MGLFGPNHARVLSRAQGLWDVDRQVEAVAELESVLPHTRPKSSVTDAFIVTTLATYVTDLGNPRRGLTLFSRIPLDNVRLTDARLICLGARSACCSAVGDLDGARLDRATIAAASPGHSALIMADLALAIHAERREGADPDPVAPTEAAATRTGVRRD